MLSILVSSKSNGSDVAFAINIFRYKEIQMGICSSMWYCMAIYNRIFCRQRLDNHSFLFFQPVRILTLRKRVSS